MKNNSILAAIICLIMSVILLGSCSLINEINVKKPEVSFIGAKLTGLSFDVADMLFDLKIRNPNPVGLTMSGFGYDFLINGNSFLKGDKNDTLSIDSGGESTIQLPLSLEYSSIYGAFKSLKDQDSSMYQINCSFAFNLPVLGDVSVPVSKSGELPMLKLPKIKLDSLKLKGVNISGANLLLNVKVDNPNAFSMILNKMNYQFDVNGRSWISGLAEEATQITEKGEGIIQIPISLNLLQMGTSVRQLLKGDSDINYKFGGEMDLATSLPLLGEIKLPFDREGKIPLIK